MAIFSITIFWIHIAPSYYGLMYALGFLAGYLILRSRKVLSDTELESLIMYIFFGVLLGGRLGYVLFYNLPYYLSNPLDIIKTWQWGMSFHGGVIGVIIAMFIFSRVHKKWFLYIADHITRILPIGLGLWRIGNYLNKELLGFSPYTGPLAIVKDWVSYFPSPLLVLFIILNIFIKKNAFPGKIATSFLIWYSIFRFCIEFIRTPDVGLGYLSFGLTLGQILSIPMIIIGIILFYYFRISEKKENALTQK